MTDKKHLEILFKNLVEGKYTLRELDELFDSFQNEEHKNSLLQLIEQHLETDSMETPSTEGTEVVARVLKKLKNQNGMEQDTIIHYLPQRTYKWKKIVAIAAAVCLFAFAGIYFYPSTQQQVGEPSLTVAHDVAPGMNKATLTLSDGRELLLDDVEIGELTAESGISIQKSANGQLIYTVQSQDAVSDINAVNTIHTPRGGQYQVVLPDGTKVWLNSSSSLTYPVHFAAESRRVEMTGETYFEVEQLLDASGKRIPFIVECPGQTIEVLGTHFNINAYADEQQIRTTLLEGSVRLRAKDGKNNILLRPGQQAKLQGNQFSIAKVSVESSIDWKNGDFYFADESLPVIMRKIARWYDVDIQYKQNLSLQENFNGSVSRGKKLSEVLRVLSISADVDLKLVDRTILVDKKKK